jgi:hypothetical protein
MGFYPSLNRSLPLKTYGNLTRKLPHGNHQKPLDPNTVHTYYINIPEQRNGHADVQLSTPLCSSSSHHLLLRFRFFKSPS